MCIRNSQDISREFISKNSFKYDCKLQSEGTFVAFEPGELDIFEIELVGTHQNLAFDLFIYTINGDKFFHFDHAMLDTA